MVSLCRRVRVMKNFLAPKVKCYTLSHFAQEIGNEKVFEKIVHWDEKKFDSFQEVFETKHQRS